MTSKIVSMPGVVRPMLYLAMPVLVEQILTTLVGFVDTWLTGHFVPGEAPMAAIGLMAYTLWLLPNMFAIVAIGCTALVSRSIGAGDKHLASKVTNQAVLGGIVLAAVVFGITHQFGDWFVSVMNLHDEAGQLANSYIRYVTMVIPAIMIQRIGIAALRAAGDTMSGLVAMSMVNIVNVAASTALVTGWGPLPELGWDGLALGTAIGHLVGGLILLVLLCRGRAGLKLHLSSMKPDWPLIGRMLRIGLPGGADVMTIHGCHLWYLGVINGLGTLAAAAHSLAIRIESIAYLPGTAFQVAATTMAGQYLGAGDQRRAMRGVGANCVAGGAVMISMGLLFFFGSNGLTSFFAGTSNDSTAQAAAPLLQLAAWAMPSLAATMILSGALRGAGDTRWPFLYTIIGMGGVRIPCALLLACHSVSLPLLGITITGLGLGVIGAWYGMLADIGLRSILISIRFGRGNWMKTRV